MTNTSMKIFLKFPRFLTKLLVVAVSCWTVEKTFSVLWKNISNIIHSSFFALKEEDNGPMVSLEKKRKL